MPNLHASNELPASRSLMALLLGSAMATSVAALPPVGQISSLAALESEVNESLDVYRAFFGPEFGPQPTQD